MKFKWLILSLTLMLTCIYAFRCAVFASWGKGIGVFLGKLFTFFIIFIVSSIVAGIYFFDEKSWAASAFGDFALLASMNLSALFGFAVVKIFSLIIRR